MGQCKIWKTMLKENSVIYKVQANLNKAHFTKQTFNLKQEQYYH